MRVTLRWLFLVALLIPAMTGLVFAQAGFISENFNSGVLPAGATNHGNAVYSFGGATVQTFDGGGTTHTITEHNLGASNPMVVGGGPTGSFLHLMDNEIGGQNNTVGFDRTFNGAPRQVSINFDFRMPVDAGHTGCCGERADGFGVALLRTAAHGTTGAAPGGVTWETPGGSLNNDFHVGFDIFDNGGPNGNNVRLHLNGADLNNAQFLNFALNNGLFNHATIDVQRVAGGSNVTVTLTPDSLGVPGAPVTVFNNQFIAGLTLDETRVAIGGRTGGAYTGLDVDNVNVNYGDPISGGAYSLTTALNGQQGGLSFADPTSGALVRNFAADFDFRIVPGSADAADGMSLSFVPTGGTGAFGELGAPTGIVFGLDTHDNGPDVSGNRALLQFNNVLLGEIDLTGLGINLENGAVHHATATMDNGQVTLLIDNTLVFSNVTLPGWTPFAGQFNFGGRTGGLNADQFIDNFFAALNTPEPSSLVLWLGLGAVGAVVAWRLRTRCHAAG